MNAGFPKQLNDRGASHIEWSNGRVKAIRAVN
jgi:hypothetical protein